MNSWSIINLEDKLNPGINPGFIILPGFEFFEKNHDGDGTYSDGI